MKNSVWSQNLHYFHEYLKYVGILLPNLNIKQYPKSRQNQHLIHQISMTIFTHMVAFVLKVVSLQVVGKESIHLTLTGPTIVRSGKFVVDPREQLVGDWSAGDTNFVTHHSGHNFDNALGQQINKTEDIIKTL